MATFLGIALLPREDDLDRAIDLQQTIGDGNSLQPRLSRGGNLPHVTLLQGPFQEGVNHGEVLKRIIGIVAPQGYVSVSSKGIGYQPKGWVFLNLARTATLEGYQDACLTAIRPHMDLTAVDLDKDISGYTEDERRSYLKYGYRYIGASFSPHITLGRTDEDKAMDLASTAARAGLGSGDWIFDRLSFYVMGEEGAHAGQLAELALTGEERPRQ
jgi:2'-5' RNA ligase